MAEQMTLEEIMDFYGAIPESAPQEEAEETEILTTPTPEDLERQKRLWREA